jgi:hypothetical protein
VLFGFRELRNSEGKLGIFRRAIQLLPIERF